MQDEYKRLQNHFDEQDKNNGSLSGVGGQEMGELADLLMTMREARGDMPLRKNVIKQ